MNDVQKVSLVAARSKLHKTKMSFVFAMNQCVCWIPNSIYDKTEFIFIIWISNYEKQSQYYFIDII